MHDAGYSILDARYWPARRNAMKEGMLDAERSEIPQGGARYSILDAGL